jgi:hypothetical protein
MALFDRDDTATEEAFGDEHLFDAEPVGAPGKRSRFRSWLARDWPYATMLVLAFVGVTFRMSVAYWVVLTPLFGIISMVAGWRHVALPEERVPMLYALALDWLALIVAIFVLYNYSVGAVLNANAMSLSLMTLLALGTFVAGVQARVWRISAVGTILLTAVPIIGWLDNSIMFLAAIAVLVIAVGGVIRWVTRRRQPAV